MGIALTLLYLWKYLTDNGCVDDYDNDMLLKLDRGQCEDFIFDSLVLCLFCIVLFFVALVFYGIRYYEYYKGYRERKMMANNWLG